jgi:hypothetical protein
MPIQKVNNKETIKNPIYYHCFKLSNSSYVLFDIKMDMPLIVGSLSIIKTFKLPPEAIIYYYKIHASGFFYKGPDKTIDIKGEGKRMKAPLRYNYIDDNDDTIFFHHFKLSNVLSVIFGGEFDKPLMYGSNQKIQMIKNQISKDKQIFVYKEDLSFKGSFKLWQVEAGSKT